jgi:uncharacterized protein
MEPRISIITLGVKDLKKSYKFYHEGLGIPTSSKSDDAIIFLKTNGTCLALYPFDELAKDIKGKSSKEKPEFTGITLAHNTKTKEEVKQVLELAKNAGGKIEKEAQNASWGGYHGYFSDPDGYLWEVAYADFWEFNDDGSLKIK